MKFCLTTYQSINLEKYLSLWSSILSAIYALIMIRFLFMNHIKYMYFKPWTLLWDIRSELTKKIKVCWQCDILIRKIFLSLISKLLWFNILPITYFLPCLCFLEIVRFIQKGKFNWFEIIGLNEDKSIKLTSLFNLWLRDIMIKIIFLKDIYKYIIFLSI